MKLFVDTANLQEIEAALQCWYVDGVTTNPSLLAKEPKENFLAHIDKIVNLLKKYKDGAHLSVEVFSRDPNEILKQAEEFWDALGYDALSIKVQVGWNELGVIRQLADRGISVNCTACMSVDQAVWAAKAGAQYASLFWGRIRDASPAVLKKKMQSADDTRVIFQQLNLSQQMVENGVATESDFDPISVARRTRQIFDREGWDCEIITGSMRSVWDVRDAMLSGAHIVTVPYKFFPEFHRMAEHYKTDEVVQQFLTDFANWLK